MRFLAAALIATIGCSGLINFDVDSAGQTTIPGSLLPTALNFAGFNNLSFSQSAQFSNNNTNKDHISSAHITQFSLKVVTPAGASLAFLNQVDFFIQAPNLPKIHIAGLNPVPAQTLVSLTLDNVDIAAYAKSDNFSITTSVTGGHSPSSDTTIEADLRLHIDASVL